MEVAAQSGKRPGNAVTNVPPTILLVDGDPLILATLAKGLQEHGFQTLTASEAEGAKAKLKECTPDLVIMDFDLAGDASPGLARFIASTSDVPFMFLSASSDESYYRSALNLGAIGYLVKPLDPVHIALSIWAGLKITRANHRLRDESLDLSNALHADRDVSVVTGFLMERLAVTQKRAYEALRQCARNRRRGIKDLSREILGSAETLGGILAEIQALLSTRTAETDK